MNRMNKIEIGSVIVCVAVLLFCYVGYGRYASWVVYDVEDYYPEVEDCSARLIEEMPEGYEAGYYRGDADDLAEMEVVEVTWRLSNNTNERMGADRLWADYYMTDSRDLCVMERERAEDSLVSTYDNEELIPPAGQTDYKEYLLVPEGCHEIEVKARFSESQPEGERETFILEF